MRSPRGRWTPPCATRQAPAARARARRGRDAESRWPAAACATPTVVPLRRRQDQEDAAAHPGHECSGTVVMAGPGPRSSSAAKVVVPAVLPCGECDLCRPVAATPAASRSCPATTSRRLREPPQGAGALRVPVILAATSCGSWAWSPTRHHAVPGRRAREVKAGDVAVIIGVGASAPTRVQVCAPVGASVIAIDVDEAKLERIRGFGATATVSAKGWTPRIKDAVKNAGQASSPCRRTRGGVRDVRHGPRAGHRLGAAHFAGRWLHRVHDGQDSRSASATSWPSMRPASATGAAAPSCMAPPPSSCSREGQDPPLQQAFPLARDHDVVAGVRATRSGAAGAGAVASDSRGGPHGDVPVGVQPESLPRPPASRRRCARPRGGSSRSCSCLYLVAYLDASTSASRSSR